MDKVQICIPSRGMIEDAFCASLIALYKKHPELPLPLLGHGGAIHSVRQELIEQALVREMEHVLFLDSDHKFPDYTLEALMKHKAPIVAVNYLNRHHLPQWVASQNGQALTSLNKKGLESITVVGLGVMLIDLSIFQKIPKPYFDMLSRLNDHGKMEYAYEDTYFCRKAQDAGFPVLIDHDLTQAVDHSIHLRGSAKGFQLG